MEFQLLREVGVTDIFKVSPLGVEVSEDIVPKNSCCVNYLTFFSRIWLREYYRGSMFLNKY